MSKKITLIVDTIITPYEISRYEAINTVLKDNLLVWFQAKSDINRNWHSLPKINFNYEVLHDTPFRLIGKDVHTLHINFQILKKLALLQQNIKQVIICGWDSPNYWLIVSFCKKNKIPYILWSGSTHYEKSWRRTLFLPLIKWIVAGASRYIAYGSRAQLFLESLGASADKTIQFINSVDIDYFIQKSIELFPQKDNIRKQIGISPTDFVYLYIGQLIERKGVSDLLKAFATQSMNCKLLVVGTGPMKSALLNAEAPLKGKIIHIPKVEYNDIFKYYAAADCLILPSHEEVWGLVVNEALASGMPVIASSAVGAAPELVFDGKTGYTYPSGDVSALALCMNKIKNTQFDMKSIQQSVLFTSPQKMAHKVFSREL